MENATSSVSIYAVIVIQTIDVFRKLTAATRITLLSLINGNKGVYFSGVEGAKQDCSAGILMTAHFQGFTLCNPKHSSTKTRLI